jgi:hypothetical protein
VFSPEALFNAERTQLLIWGINDVIVSFIFLWILSSVKWSDCDSSCYVSIWAPKAEDGCFLVSILLDFLWGGPPHTHTHC